MNEMINALGKRLQGLMCDVHFRYDFDKVPDSPEQLLEIGEHNSREYEKIEAMGEERKERIWNLISNILASVFQKQAIEKYGNTESSSIRQVLQDLFTKPDNRIYWDRLTQVAKQCLLDCSLSEDQYQTVITYYCDILPQAIIEVLDELISHIRLLPRTEAPQINNVLVDMMMEAKNAN